MQYANRFDIELQGVFETREKDWRNGAIVYQVLVDRFAPAAKLDAKRHLYAAPRTLHTWQETPAKGRYLAEHGLWSHELAFWGGDLASTAARLGYLQELGADVLYLNPIFHALTNHKYDTLDYLQVSPEYGTRAEVRALADDLHSRGMKLVLDGVFNHMGRKSRFFQQAQAEEHSPYRDWFRFDPSCEGGARTWWRALNLPELNLENPRVREHIYAAHDSVVRSWLREGVDGWRLDVAFDIGFVFLEQLKGASHQEKAGSLVVGEIANYPKEWFPSVDAVMQFVLRGLMLRLVSGELDAPSYGRMLTRLVEETGIENMLKSWIYLDNHDTPRLATELPDPAARRLAQVLQFTLPGAPNLYYGSELDMVGGHDPEMRAPMRWDLATPDNATLQWTRRLIRLHHEHRALRVGNYRPISSNRLLAFERYTDRASDSVLVIVNPGPTTISETLMVANSKLMDSSRLVDLLESGPAPEVRLRAALLQLTMPPQSVRVLKPDTEPDGGYSSYKRVR